MLGLQELIYATNLFSLLSHRTRVDRQSPRNGEPLRNIAKRVSISPAGLLRHKSHVAGTLIKAQERREEDLGDSIYEEMRRVLAKAWELLAEAEGDHRGAIVALREVRECLESLNGLLTTAEGGSGEINISVVCIGADKENLPRREQQTTVAASHATVPLT